MCAGSQAATRLGVGPKEDLCERPIGDPAIDTYTLGEERMQRGLLAQLSPHERTTLRRIANGDDRSGTLNLGYVAQLLSLAHRRDSLGVLPDGARQTKDRTPGELVTGNY
jgi:hypothetical protein